MIKLRDVIRELDLETITPPADLEVNTRYACASDLLSNVMATCPGNCLWITVQCHANVIGVASLLDMQAIILAGGNRPDKKVVEKAAEVGVAILASRESSFDICGRLHTLGLRGMLKGEL
jgi:hypothetical protein